ncbi:MAG: hypothetical protein KA265_11505 [Piscinibacter sp.]|nr:hypothetical protein [Piscinibacter sp.]MBP6636067.1 hypothetical protein [Sulfuritalea sp.]
MRWVVAVLVVLATALNTIALVVLVALLGSTGAFAQGKLSLNCAAGCTAIATWAPPYPAQASPLTGCVLYIDGVPYAGGSSVTVADAECRMPLPALPKGVYELRAAGVNDSGEGPQGAPLYLGTPVGRPDVQRRPHR